MSLLGQITGEPVATLIEAGVNARLAIRICAGPAGVVGPGVAGGGVAVGGGGGGSFAATVVGARVGRGGRGARVVRHDAARAAVGGRVLVLFVPIGDRADAAERPRVRAARI